MQEVMAADDERLISTLSGHVREFRKLKKLKLGVNDITL